MELPDAALVVAIRAGVVALVVTALGRLRRWWATDRPVYLHRRWRFGWRGDGWNGLMLGPVTVWFRSGPSPAARIRGRLQR